MMAPSIIITKEGLWIVLNQMLPNLSLSVCDIHSNTPTTILTIITRLPTFSIYAHNLYVDLAILPVPQGMTTSILHNMGDTCSLHARLG
jgi:hypothetical protein